MIAPCARSTRAYRPQPARPRARSNAPRPPERPQARAAAAASQHAAERAEPPQSRATPRAQPAAPARRRRRRHAAAAAAPPLWAAMPRAAAAGTARVAHAVQPRAQRPPPRPRPSQADPRRRWPPAHTAARSPAALWSPWARPKPKQAPGDGNAETRWLRRKAPAPGTAQSAREATRDDVAVPDARQKSATTACRMTSLTWIWRRADRRRAATPAHDCIPPGCALHDTLASETKLGRDMRRNAPMQARATPQRVFAAQCRALARPCRAWRRAIG